MPKQYILSEDGYLAEIPEGKELVDVKITAVASSQDDSPLLIAILDNPVEFDGSKLNLPEPTIH